MRKLSCTEASRTSSVEGDDRYFCDKATVLDESVSGTWFYNTLISSLGGDVSDLTGGKYGGAYTTYTPEVGTEIDLRSYDDRGIDNGVSLVYLRYPEAHTDSDYKGSSYAYSWTWEAGNRAYSWVIIDDLEDREGTFPHEIAHTLGYMHPNGYDFSQYPGGSTMGNADMMITTRDMLHGRILYDRAVGSLSPDVDPSGFKVNAAMYQRGAGRGRLIMEIHCCR
jgi:hypothetical protein